MTPTSSRDATSTSHTKSVMRPAKRSGCFEGRAGPGRNGTPRLRSIRAGPRPSGARAPRAMAAALANRGIVEPPQRRLGPAGERPIRQVACQDRVAGEVRVRVEGHVDAAGAGGLDGRDALLPVHVEVRDVGADPGFAADGERLLERSLDRVLVVAHVRREDGIGPDGPRHRDQILGPGVGVRRVVIAPREPDRAGCHPVPGRPGDRRLLRRPWAAGRRGPSRRPGGSRTGAGRPCSGRPAPSRSGPCTRAGIATPSRSTRDSRRTPRSRSA